MRFATKSLISLLAILPMFEGMVTAFHLLNLPSDLAVLEGVCLLTLTGVAGALVFRWIWRSRRVSRI
jgi:hypothetical protein